MENYFLLLLKFYERFKVTLVSFFIADLNLLSCKLDDFTFKASY